MKLSEAIRLGSMLKPQAFGVQAITRDYPPVPGDVLGLRVVHATCAWGAAMDACQVPTKIATGSTISLRWGSRTADVPVEVIDPPDEWARVLYQPMACPACVDHTGTAFQMIAHLNDYHSWTRERIAKWIEDIERVYEPDGPTRVSMSAQGDGDPGASEEPKAAEEGATV